MKNIPTNTQYKKLIAFLFYVFTAFFLFLYIRKLDFGALNEIHLQPWFVLFAFPFSVISRIFLPHIWIQLIRVYQPVSKGVSYIQLNYIYAKTWLGKYIPGNVAYIAGKIYFASSKGVNKKTLAVTSVLEVILQILTALFLGVIFLYLTGNYANFSGYHNLFFLTSVIVGLVTISPPIFNRLLDMGYKLLKKERLEKKYYISLKNVFKFFTLYMLVHSLSAFPIFFLIKALGYDLSLVGSLYVTGAFIFAGAIGSLAVFVPSGLGVREAILIVFLANVLPPEVALVLVVVLRIWSVALDVIYWLLSYTALYISQSKLST